MKKRYLIFLAAIMLLLSFNFIVSGATQLKVSINGFQTDIGTATVNNKVYVDAEAFANQLGLSASKTSNSINISTKNDDIIPNIIKSISPSVVGIIGNIDSGNSTADGVVLGTGVIIKSGGDILTNAHVVENMSRIIVVLNDGTGYEARIKYIDKPSDLAVIKIDRIGLTAATLGKMQDIVIGKTAIAIGTPMSFQNRNSASVGVISGLNRSVDGFYQYKLIQTDAAINPGNSGGPLLTTKGEVIGINSMTTVNAQGLSYAIPIDTVQYVLNHFYKYGKVKRVTLGADFEEDYVALYGLPSKNGLKITSIKKGSCSEKYGLKKDDFIYSINGVYVNTLVDLNEAYKSVLPGNKVKVGVRRNGKTQSINVVMDELK
ncbi:S1C family serine protease [Ruminiclostridium cellulolyticum]|uniref:Peptidase S1 and S6 chymotrypsin/Hap n=1 Tax=Ruminiclostridium cellulolyticum (strain ATCC 35319 / DSM 5812 / JCM 6584 / H10) TaxID=394503 RepID=B8I2S7_RUMCH|nr:trypsin-like peptidase domain-containing protein [Ruminiclostridium cellulolyticum]ACL76070.1 peptidase S1 and S6 chymotrypsin/Hap [Ruminiclostridium cellulolyticum H10]